MVGGRGGENKPGRAADSDSGGFFLLFVFYNF